MSVVTRPLTYEDLCRAREDGNRYELIEGELILVAAPSPKHQKLSHRLVVVFDHAVVEPGLGDVYAAPLDVRFADGSVVQPDVIVVLADRLGIVEETLIEGAPSLLGEIVSRSSRATDRRTKARLYARHGVPEYWLVDPERRSTTIHADPIGEEYRVVRRESETARSVTIPGLAVDLVALFAGIPATS